MRSDKQVDCSCLVANLEQPSLICSTAQDSAEVFSLFFLSLERITGKFQMVSPTIPWEQEMIASKWVYMQSLLPLCRLEYSKPVSPYITLVNKRMCVTFAIILMVPANQQLL